MKKLRVREVSQDETVRHYRNLIVECAKTGDAIGAQEAATLLIERCTQFANTHFWAELILDEQHNENQEQRE